MIDCDVQQQEWSKVDATRVEQKPVTGGTQVTESRTEREESPEPIVLESSVFIVIRKGTTDLFWMGTETGDGKEGKLSLPGGTFDTTKGDKDIVDTCIRETQEETGWKPDRAKLTLLPIQVWVQRPKGRQCKAQFMHYVADTEEVRSLYNSIPWALRLKNTQWVDKDRLSTLGNDRLSWVLEHFDDIWNVVCNPPAAGKAWRVVHNLKQSSASGGLVKKLLVDTVAGATGNDTQPPGTGHYSGFAAGVNEIPTSVLVYSRNQAQTCATPTDGDEEAEIPTVYRVRIVFQFEEKPNKVLVGRKAWRDELILDLPGGILDGTKGDKDLKDACVRACRDGIGLQVDRNRLEQLPIMVWTTYKDNSLGCTAFAKYTITTQEELEIHMVVSCCWKVEFWMCLFVPFCMTM